MNNKVLPGDKHEKAMRQRYAKYLRKPAFRYPNICRNPSVSTTSSPKYPRRRISTNKSSLPMTTSQSIIISIKPMLSICPR